MSQDTDVSDCPPASSGGLPRFLRRRLTLSEREATFSRRGFASARADKQRGLEEVGKTFIRGFNLALDRPEADALGLALARIPSAMRGFAYEGAAMALALLDRLTPWKHHRRFDAFLAGPGDAHAYMLHVGLGWALARLPWGLESSMNRLDPLLRWLAIDGYGFHEGYFNWKRSIEGRRVPARLRGYARRAFDQGLGRCLWFHGGARPASVADTVAGFDGSRHADLWAGVGLAASYAGEADAEELALLKTLADGYVGELCQGVCFAAKARQRASNPTEHTALACEVLAGRGVDEAARICDQALIDLPADGDLPAYEAWRQRIRAMVD